MKKNRLFSLLLVCSILASLFILPASAAEPPELLCRNAILMDANHQEILYEKNARDKAYPASLTKVMTALLVLEAIEAGQLDANAPVTAAPSALEGITAGASSAGLKPGMTLTVEELLYCLLVPSANEAANILAVALDGSVSEFVAHMNRRAAELGCQGTHFANPHGLHSDDHYTTAYDMALMMDKALEFDLFRTIIATPDHRIPANDTHPELYFFNTNGLISNLHYFGHVYDKCIGGKTGTTDEAGKCLVAAAKNGDDLLISVVLGAGVVTAPDGSKKQGNFTESTKLLEWGFRNFKRVTITRDAVPVDKVAVTLSRQADEVMVKPQGSVTRTLPVDVDLSQIETEISLFSPTVEAPVKEGQVLGTMKLSHNGELYGTLDLVAVASVERSEFLYKKAQFSKFFHSLQGKLILIAVLLFVLVPAIYFLGLRKKRRVRSSFGRSRGHYRGGHYRGGRR